MGTGRNLFRNYGYLRKYFISLLLVLAVVLQIIHNPITQIIQIGAIILLGLFVLQVLFEILEKPTILDRPQRFYDFYQALPVMKEYFENSLKRENTLSIGWLDTSLEHALTFVNNVLKPILHDNRRNVMKIELTMVDPSWPEIEKINSSWLALGKSNYESLRVFMEVYKEVIKNQGWSIEISLYHHLPNFQGFLINSQHLFFSACTWKDGFLSDDNPFELYHTDDRFGGKEKIEQFISWFDHCQKESPNPLAQKLANPGVTFYITNEGKKS